MAKEFCSSNTRKNVIYGQSKMKTKKKTIWKKENVCVWEWVKRRTVALLLPLVLVYVFYHWKHLSCYYIVCFPLNELYGNISFVVCLLHFQNIIFCSVLFAAVVHVCVRIKCRSFFVFLTPDSFHTSSILEVLVFAGFQLCTRFYVYSIV